MKAVRFEVERGHLVGGDLVPFGIDAPIQFWEGDTPLGRPSAQTIVYEMHVRGFTRHPSSGVGGAARGTFAGVIEKIPYLQALGITAVELMPVFQFDAQDCPRGKVNDWGYAPVSFWTSSSHRWAKVRRWVAPMDRHVSGLSGRHRPVADGAAGVRPDLPGGGALGRGAVRIDRVPGGPELRPHFPGRMGEAARGSVMSAAMRPASGRCAQSRAQ